MARFPGSLVLLRKVQYGYRFLPPRDPGKKVVAEIPPSTLLSLDSFVAFGNLSGGSHNFLAYAQASISKMILQTVAGIRAIFRGLRTKGFSERILAFGLRVCPSHSSPNLHNSNFIVHGDEYGHNADRNLSLCSINKINVLVGAGLLIHVGIDT